MTEADDRPWERPGAVRRDCEPHRGDVLLLLGYVSYVLAFASCFGGIAALLALPLGVVVAALAARDLMEMRQRHMDPAGSESLHEARLWAAFAVAFSLATGVAWAAVGFWLLLR